MNSEQLVTILIAFAAATPGILAFFAQRRKSSAEAKDIGVTTLQKVIQTLNEQVDSLKADQKVAEVALEKAKQDLDAGHEMLRSAREQIAVAKGQLESVRLAANHLLEGVTILSRQLRENNITPAWRPDQTLLRPAGLSFGPQERLWPS